MQSQKSQASQVISSLLRGVVPLIFSGSYSTIVGVISQLLKVTIGVPCYTVLERHIL